MWRVPSSLIASSWCSPGRSLDDRPPLRDLVTGFHSTVQHPSGRRAASLPTRSSVAGQPHTVLKKQCIVAAPQPKISCCPTTPNVRFSHSNGFSNRIGVLTLQCSCHRY